MGKKQPKKRIEQRLLRSHPSQAELFGDVNDAELQVLADDLGKNGLRESPTTELRGSLDTTNVTRAFLFTIYWHSPKRPRAVLPKRQGLSCSPGAYPETQHEAILRVAVYRGPLTG
jgi:hypothetical protein